MPFKFISQQTKPNASVPDFDIWVDTVPQSFLDQFAADFPETVGLTAMEIVMLDVNTETEPSEGFISEENSVSEDGLVTTRTTTWVNKDAYLMARNKVGLKTVPASAGNNYTETRIQKPSTAISALYASENGIVTVYSEETV